jgi:hypothetical protein
MPVMEATRSGGYCSVHHAQRQGAVRPRSNLDKPVGLLGGAVADRTSPLRLARPFVEQKLMRYGASGPPSGQFRRSFSTPAARRYWRLVAHAAASACRPCWRCSSDFVTILRRRLQTGRPSSCAHSRSASPVSGSHRQLLRLRHSAPPNLGQRLNDNTLLFVDDFPSKTCANDCAIAPSVLVIAADASLGRE